MEKYSCEDDGPDIGGNESIDGPSESGIREHACTAVNFNDSKVPDLVVFGPMLNLAVRGSLVRIIYEFQ